MRFAELHKRAKIRDKYWTFDMTINISTDFACLPGAQTPFSVWSCLRGFGINLLPQQRGGLKYRAVNRLFVIQLTDSRIEQRDYVVHPFAWPCRTYLRDSLRLSYGLELCEVTQVARKTGREKGVAVRDDDGEFVRLLHGSITRLWNYG
jgi:hypothetical protein